jgi:hypothetical protein
MKLTFWIDDRLAAAARMRAEASGKNLDDLVREYLRTFADDDPELTVAEFKRSSGGGNSGGWRFDRDEIHKRP